MLKNGGELSVTKHAWGTVILMDATRIMDFAIMSALMLNYGGELSVIISVVGTVILMDAIR